MVSKFDHAMLHLLYQIRVGWLDADVVGIVSNHPDAQRTALAAQIPLGRLGAPGDIAEAVCFLAGPGAAWITGETLNVNGGMHMA